MMSYHPVDVLEGIFLFYPDEEFPNDREAIHSAFHEIRRNHFDLLKELVFRDNLLFPRSRVLDESLTSMQPDFLRKYNPTYDTYEIKRANIRKHWDSELKTIFEGLEEELKAVAIELSAHLKNA